MFWFTNFKTAVASLRQSKWRSMLTMLGIIIGVTSVVTIVSLGEGLKHQVNKQINQLGSNIITVRSGKLVTRDKGGDVNGVNLLAFLNTSTLTMKDVDALNKLPSAESVAPINFVTSSAKTASASSDNLFVIGTSPALADMLHQTTSYGEFFDQDQSNSNLAVIGNNVAHQLFGENNPVGQSITIEGQDFIIRGVLKQTAAGILTVAQTDFNSSVFIPSQASLQLTDNRTNILQILVKSKSDSVDNTISDINQALLKTHDGQQNFTVLKQQELRDIADGTVSIVAGFISGIAAISLLVGELASWILCGLACPSVPAKSEYAKPWAPQIVKSAVSS